MHIYLKQEYLSLHNTFFAYSDAEEQKYVVDESNFSLGHKFTISQNQTTIATVKQQSFGFKPNFDIQIGENHYVLSRVGNLQDSYYNLSGVNWQIGGDILGQDYIIIDETDTQVGSVTFKDTIIGDALDIYTIDPANEPLILAATIAIEADSGDQIDKLEKSQPEA